MSFWKVLAGAATGVAVVVALPVAGPIGAITAVGAAVAGTAGAAAGGLASAADDTEERAERRGQEKAKAEYSMKLQKYADEFCTWAENWSQYGDKLVAATAVGLACANCDGEIHEDELQEIDEFISGALHSNLPKQIHSGITKLRRNPPNLVTAYELANEHGLDSDLVDDIIDLVIHADGRVHPQEDAFLAAWAELRV